MLALVSFGKTPPPRSALHLLKEQPLQHVRTACQRGESRGSAGRLGISYTACEYGDHFRVALLVEIEVGISLLEKPLLLSLLLLPWLFRDAAYHVLAEGGG